jgi:DNA adenine methylase
MKWAGGKTQLLGQFSSLYPAAGSVIRYVEPFVGSGAVFFHVREFLKPGKVILADDNEELINVYRCLRDDVEGVIRRLVRHRGLHSEEHYYKVRGRNPARLAPAGRAARVIYLNKTCFNGLYRVNRSGKFNVPMGSYENPRILDPSNLRAAAAALKGVTLRRTHFRKTLDDARKGDFIYFDPPYHPISETAHFTSYSAEGGKARFDEEDQRELAAVYTKLARRGCRVMLSNSDCPFVRRLYRRFRICRVQARRSINSRADRRGEVHEAVVLNYEPPGRKWLEMLAQA